MNDEMVLLLVLGSRSTMINLRVFNDNIKYDLLAPTLYITLKKCWGCDQELSYNFNGTSVHCSAVGIWRITTMLG